MALPTLPAGVTRPAERALLEARAVGVVARAGMLPLRDPAALVGGLAAVARYGSVGGAPVLAAKAHGDRLAFVDDHGSLTFAELDARTNAVANALRARGLADGETVGILCRNHAGAVLAAFGCARAGSRAVYLNSASAPPQLAEVVEREGVRLLLLDEDLEEAASLVPAGLPRVRVFDEGGAEPLAELLAEGARTPAPAPERHGSIVLLTSGTTGTPKGAPRAAPRGLLIPGALLERLPFRARETTVVCAPVFHGTGLALTFLQVSLGNTVVLRRRFDAAQVLTDLREHRASGLVVVPVMLHRLLAEGPEAVAGLDLRVVFCAGSQLSGELGTRALDLLGPCVYNLYGSTEVSYATIATPQDLRAAPGTTGRPAMGARVRILGPDDRDVPAGETGRVFVGNTTRFEGYTGGGGKDEVDGLLATGDVGHLDAAGRLTIDGRDDEMLVSGGENVFPREVEELLVTHPGIDDAAACGVPDEQFGERLAVWVVPASPDAVTADEVRAFVRDHLARYKVPRDVHLTAELPRNAAGKVLKRELLG